MFLTEHGLRLPHRPPEARPRLETRLQRAAGLPMLLLVAAHGYGKTAALARLAHLDPRPAIWYRCSPGEPPGALAHHLVMSVAGPFAVASASAPDDWWRILAESMTAAAQPRLLLIDDVHNLTGPQMDLLVQYLSAQLPAGWSAAVASASELEQREFTRLLAQGDAAYLDERDLELDRDEARVLASSIGVSNDEADRACDRASGWPLGVIVVLEGREAWLADYFSMRVLDPLPGRARRFLEACLVLGTVTAQSSRAVSRMNDAVQLLTELAANHVFLRQTGPHQIGFLPLFRTTVLEMVRRQHPRLLARWAARAAQHFADAGEPGAGLRVLVDVGEVPAAVELLRRIAPGAVAAGRAVDLRNWIAVFPPAVRDCEAWLLHYQGVSLRLVGDYSSAWPVQEQARGAFRAAGIREGYAYAVAELGTLACMMKRPTEAEQLLEEARAALGESDEVHHAAVLCALADAYVALNRLREATEAGEEAVALTSSDATWPLAGAHVHALQRLGLVRMREGAFGQALDVITRALELGREHHVDVETGTDSSLVLGLIRWGTGDLERADEVLSAAGLVATRHGLRGLQNSIGLARAGVLTDLGRLDEADRLFNASGDPAAFPSIDGRAGLAWLRVLQNRAFEARGVFRQILEESSLAGSAADVGRAKASLGVIALRLGRADEAEQWLLDAARGFEASGARYRLAGTQLHLADLYLSRNDSNRSRRYLKMALDYAATAESYHFFLWHPATIARLAVFALREGLHPDYVETLSVRRLAGSEVPHFLPLLSQPQSQIVAVARRIVDALLARAEGVAAAGLDQCADDAARLRLTRAILEGCLTARGLLLLRHQYCLTWAEADVFVAYYLTELGAIVVSTEPERRSLARRLAVSENTLRHHITSIRHKLGLSTGRGSASVFIWALIAGIAVWPPANSRSTD